MSFKELGLDDLLVRTAKECGYTAPTPIQQEAIPILLGGHDLLGAAQTGTGKTAAFVFPMLNSLIANPQVPVNKFGVKAIRAVILVPTRELASQIDEQVIKHTKYIPTITSCVIFGGVPHRPQITAFKEGVDIVIATPGRLLELQEMGLLDFSLVRMAVLDEADRMLDMGFVREVKKIFAPMSRNKQTAMFSATFTPQIETLAQTFLKNPKTVQVTPQNSTVQRITQSFHLIGRDAKMDALLHVITKHNWNQVLVFTRTKSGANEVSEFLKSNNITSMALHGNKSQARRIEALSEFKTGSLRVLVATDVAARGIDIQELPHVINLDIPSNSEDYVHRIGRTGRAGRPGVAVSFVSLDEERWFHDIIKFAKMDKDANKCTSLAKQFDPKPLEIAEPIAFAQQVFWGGMGPRPSGDVIRAAQQAARSKLSQSKRDQKKSQVKLVPKQSQSKNTKFKAKSFVAAAKPVATQAQYRSKNKEQQKNEAKGEKRKWSR